MTMAAPVSQIRAFTQEYVAKWRMAGITWTAEHEVLAIDLTREKNAVSVERQKGIFHLVERLKIVRIANSDCGAMIIIAPGDIIPTIDADNTGIV